MGINFQLSVDHHILGWKRLILSDGPRQSINALTLYSFWLVNSGSLTGMENYWLAQSLVTKFLLISILFTVLVFLGSLCLLILAAICYVPLLCYIQGNLKEYCCHKVDKVCRNSAGSCYTLLIWYLSVLAN